MSTIPSIPSPVIPTNHAALDTQPVPNPTPAAAFEASYGADLQAFAGGEKAVSFTVTAPDAISVTFHDRNSYQAAGTLLNDAVNGVHILYASDTPQPAVATPMSVMDAAARLRALPDVHQAGYSGNALVIAVADLPTIAHLKPLFVRTFPCQAPGGGDVHEARIAWWIG